MYVVASGLVCVCVDYINNLDENLRWLDGSLIFKEHSTKWTKNTKNPPAVGTQHIT